MPEGELHRLGVYIFGLERSRDRLEELLLIVDGSGPERRPIYLRPDTRCYELFLPVGMYHLAMRFTIGRRQFSRSLSAVKVPLAAAAQFDLAQVIADAMLGAMRPATRVSHRAVARIAAE